jgi:hypothetical protein
MRLERFNEADAIPHSRCCRRLWHWLLGLVASVLLALYVIFLILQRAVDAALAIAFSQV